MQLGDHLEALDREGKHLAEAAAAASLTDPVPGCPDWTVRDLLAHVGEVHRWAAAIVRTGATSPRDLPEGSVSETPDDAQLLEWYVEGHRALLQTLRNAPADLECYAFLPAPSPREFWARRQAHETSIHRADASGAAREVVHFDEALAHDGIHEMLHGFALRPRVFDPGTILLDAAGGQSWLVTLNADGASTTPATSDSADATVRGTATDVYLWLWNRPSAASITGDASVAERWRQIRVRWS